ncbi:phage holin family protein [Nissabacter sp. SGAir0207]|uniref:phage holin family protein n=1 Tax=Nissabacter sp. SGAir0207 TaxID=2126321 RepID=UPI0010CCCB7B|nr:phage holin family protein [Nissabacter sp. SGAir0207]QCR37322.1 hypothetical protein C1N62_15165 [Nissabacter sp. SGAir0207]
MADYQKPESQGPAKGVLDVAHRVTTTLVGLIETRVKLAVVELEEEKSNLVQLLLMTGISLILLVFGLVSLLVLIFWAIDPDYRQTALWIATAALLVLGGGLAIWTLVKAKRSTLLGATRRQLQIDRAMLEKKIP